MTFLSSKPTWSSTSKAQAKQSCTRSSSAGNALLDVEVDRKPFIAFVLAADTTRLLCSNSTGSGATQNAQTVLTRSILDASVIFQTIPATWWSKVV